MLWADGRCLAPLCAQVRHACDLYYVMTPLPPPRQVRHAWDLEGWKLHAAYAAALGAHLRAAEAGGDAGGAAAIRGRLAALSAGQTRPFNAQALPVLDD